MLESHNLDDTPLSPEPIKPAVSLDRLKRMFRLAMDAADENNRAAINDRDFYDGQQLSAEERAEMRARGQPEIINNLIAPGINGVLGVIDATDTDAEAEPNTSLARASADMATKLIRFAARKAKYKKAKNELAANFLVEGCCAAAVTCHPHPKNGRPVIEVERIHWEDFFFDQDSREVDFADARFLGTAPWLNAEEIAAKFPHAYDALGEPFDCSGTALFDSKGDLSARRWWVDTDSKRIRVIDMYFTDDHGEWHRAIFCEKGFFYTGPSEYEDDEGVSICPIVASSYQIRQDNARYGMVRNMKPLQKSVNGKLIRLAHLVNHRQVQQTIQNVPAANKAIAKKEAARADGAIPYGWEARPTPDLAQGQMLILTQATESLNRLAPTPAVLGRITGTSESGRARQILQQAGLTEIAPFIGRLDDLDLAIYEQIWFRIRQFYDTPMEIRVSGQGQAHKFLSINEPVMGMVEQPVIDPATGQPAIDPHTGQPVTQIVQAQIGVRNRPAEIDVDINISTVPASVNLDHEIWEQLLQLAGSLSISPLDPSFDMILKLSPIPGIDEKIEQIKVLRQEAQEAGAAQQQVAQAMGAAKLKSEVELKHAKSTKDEALAAKAKADADRVSLETSMIVQQIGAANPTAVDSHTFGVIPAQYVPHNGIDDGD